MAIEISDAMKAYSMAVAPRYSPNRAMTEANIVIGRRYTTSSWGWQGGSRLLGGKSFWGYSSGQPHTTVWNV